VRCSFEYPKFKIQNSKFNSQGRASEAQEATSLEDEEGGEVGEGGHEDELADGPFPGTGFPCYYGGSR
jgi:hypothetical protein